VTDPIATASINIVPNFGAFRTSIQAQLNALTRTPFVIPVVASPITGKAAASITQATGATTGLANATRAQTRAAVQSAAATTSQARSMGQLQRGAASSALSMAGIRGATLAASGAFLAGAAAIALFAKSIGSAVSFTSQLSIFAETTGATADEMRRVGDAAEEMGRDLTLPGISAGDAAQAMTELAKAGLSVEDSIDGARGVLQLAIAANISFADATTLAASALNAFGLEGTEAVHVADILANAANAAQGSISDMGLALQQAAAVGRQVGLSLQDTTTFLTILAREGLRGSDAGTSLRVTLGRLINPTKKIQEELDKLGVSLRDARGNIRPDFFVNLGVAMRGMSKAQKDATLAILGGMDGMRALSILTRQSIKDVVGFRQKLDEQGTASELAQARMTGLAGASANLSNTLQGIGLNIGRSLTPALTSLTNTLTSTVSTVASIAGKFNEMFNVGAILAAVAAFKLIPPILAAISASRAALVLQLIGSMTLTFGVRGLVASLGALLGTLNPVAIAAALVATSLFLIFSRTSTATSATNALKKALDALSTANAEAARTTRELADAQGQIKTSQLALTTSQLSVVQARAALNASAAAKGSLERRQLENNLAIAIDNVRIAENGLRDARQRAADAVLLAAAAERTRKAAMADTAETISIVNGLEDAGFLSREKTIQSMEKAAAAQDALGTKESVAIARRIRALIILKKTVDKVPTEKQIEVFLEARNFKKGLNTLVNDLDAGGKDGGKKFTDGVMFAVDDLPGQMSAIMNDIFTSLGSGFATAGTQHGSLYANSFTAALQPIFNVLATLANIGKAPPPVTTTIGQRIELKESVGDTAGALRDARAEVAMLERIRAKAKENHDQDTFNAATEDLISARNRATSLEEQLASEAEAGAKSTASAAKSAADAVKDADDAVIAIFERREARRELKISIAENTKQLKDDIAAQVSLKKFLIAQIAIFRKQIKDKETERQVIAELRAKIVAVTGTISGLREDQRKEQREKAAARRERLREKRDERLEGLRLNIQIAEARGNVAAERQARERLIEALIEARRKVRRGTNEWRRLTLEIVQERKAIAELLEETEDRGQIAKKLQFEFLTQQQGFAATILGNLIPMSALGNNIPPNLFGASGPPGKKGGGKLPFATPFSAGRPVDTTGGRSEGIRTGLAADLQAGGAPRGATQAQTGTMIEVLRAILRTLQGQKRNAAVPEAQYERSKGSARNEMM
jgi:TP901 family phage tail tape measure protein